MYKINIFVLTMILFNFIFIHLGFAQRNSFQDTGWEILMPCSTGEVRPCGSNVGVCENGTRTCINAKWSDCIGGVRPVHEICDNGLDDNCNGMTDECITSPWIALVIAGILILIFAGILAKL
jgi:hypothetical protein